MNKFLAGIFCFLFIWSNAQSVTIDKTHNDSVSRELCRVNKIFYFGFDFTRFKLIDLGRVGKDEKMKIVISEIIQKINTRMPESKLTELFDKDSVVFIQEPVNKLNAQIENSKTVGNEFEYDPNKIPEDSIQNMINKYQTGLQEGIGFVQIVECFFKKTRQVSTWYVFFDIKSKKIIDTVEIKNYDVGIGNFTEYWGNALKSSLEFYLTDYYPPIRKSCKGRKK